MHGCTRSGTADPLASLQTIHLLVGAADVSGTVILFLQIVGLSAYIRCPSLSTIRSADVQSADLSACAACQRPQTCSILTPVRYSSDYTSMPVSGLAWAVHTFIALHLLGPSLPCHLGMCADGHTLQNLNVHLVKPVHVHLPAFLSVHTVLVCRHRHRHQHVCRRVGRPEGRHAPVHTLMYARKLPEPCRPSHVTVGMLLHHQVHAWMHMHDWSMNACLRPAHLFSADV